METADYTKHMSGATAILKNSEQEFILMKKREDGWSEYSSTFFPKSPEENLEEDIFYITFLIQILYNRYHPDNKIEDEQRFRDYFKYASDRAIEDVIRISKIED